MQKRIRIRSFFLILVFTFLIVSLAAYDATKLAGKDSPNVIVILTDDLDNKLMPYMENTNSLIAKQGATFTNYFVTSAVCCPSRASMFRGQYPHNTQILDNAPGFPSFYAKGEEEETVAVWLKKEGYKTALIGKYLNYYPIPAGWSYIPPGWTEWDVILHQTTDGGFGPYYYKYRLNENGDPTDYGNTAQDYSTDVIKRKSVDFINKNIKEGSPYFLLVSPYAPHGPSDPAPRHADMFADLKYPQSPAFAEKDLSDKPAVLQELAQNGDEFDTGDADGLFRKRVRTVQAVDELVAEVIQALEKGGQLENTYVIFTSDNGFHMGEHGLPSGKGTPYEEDIRVPFLIRGPGIQANSEVTQITANVDLAQTVADIAGASTADFVDGRSFLPLLHPEKDPAFKWRKALLIEKGYPESESSSFQLVSLEQRGVAEYPDSPYDDILRKVGGGTYQGIRTNTFKYIEYENGELEYYDLVNDPYELDNIAATLDPDTLASLHEWLAQFKVCTADDCRKFDSSLPNDLTN
jgi:N-acetylglucosamine-6-sulfatase